MPPAICASEWASPTWTMSIWRGETSVTQGLHRHPQHGSDHKSFDIEDDILKIPRGVHAEGACRDSRTVWFDCLANCGLRDGHASGGQFCSNKVRDHGLQALGVYNTLQSLGFFASGAVGGWLSKHIGPGGLFGTCAALMLVWWPMRAPQARQTAEQVLAD
jgi:hypothetical protein